MSHFYPVELLSHRRGKLAPLWLAATSSETAFKKCYKSGAIKKINIVEACKEILEIIQSKKRSVRFSLYLSSQLMCGMARIHLYQTVLYQKEAFEMQRKLETTLLNELLKSKEDAEFDVNAAFECPDIDAPLLRRSAQLDKDLHLLPGEDLDDRLQIAMKKKCIEWLDFGVLNDEQLKLMLESDYNIPLEQLERLQISKEKDISEKMADVTITEEIQEKQLSQEIRSPVLVDVSKRNKSKERLSLTPQKRQPHQMQVETPTKRRRLSFETAMPDAPPAMTDVLPAPVEDVAVPAPELPIEETGMLVIPQQKETDIELESLHSSYFVIKKKRKIIDQKTSLDDTQLNKWRQNVHVHCKQLDKLPPKNSMMTPAKNLFEQPSHLPKRWSSSLRNRFFNRITGSFTSVDEDVAPAEFTQFPEAMRVKENKTTSRLDDLTTLGNIEIAEPADSIVNILPVANVIHETMDVSMAPLPEVVPDAVTLESTSIVGHKPDQEKTNISNVDDFEDIEILLGRQRRSPEIEHVSVLPTTPIRPSSLGPPALEKHDIMAMLEVLWNEKEAVEFTELIPDTYTKEDAMTAFEILLDFYAEKKVVLAQIDFSSPLMILKYHN